MENIKEILQNTDSLMNYIYQMLWDETSTQTKNRVNSGKNRYRIKNDIKRWMEETSKFLDDIKSKYPNVSFSDIDFHPTKGEITIKNLK